MRPFRLRRLRLPLLFAVAACLGLAGVGAQDGVGHPPLDTRWLLAKGLAQPLAKDETGVVVTCRVQGQEQSIFLPFAQNTFLWKGSDSAKAGTKTLSARDGRYAVTLARLDLSDLPKEAEIVEATLRFKVSWLEKKGAGGQFDCTRVLSPWTENATWLKPDHDEDAVWNGMAAGKDYEAAPFASAKVDKLDTVDGANSVSIPGFADAVKAWRDGTWENRGFTLTFSGPAVQVIFPSRKAHWSGGTFTLGGARNGSLLLIPNLPLLERIVLKPADLLKAEPVLTLSPRKAGAPGKASLYVVTLAPDGESIDFQGGRRLVASVPLPDPTGGPWTLPDVADALRLALGSSGAPRTVAFVVAVEGGADAPPVVVSNSGDNAPQLRVQVPSAPPTHLFQPAVTPKPGVYTQVRDGHLFYGGQRLRLWGVVGAPDVQRLVDLGFNAERIWGPSAGTAYTPESAKQGELAPHAKGDGSKFDKQEQHVAELKAHGMFIMFAALNDTIPAKLLLDDDSFVAKGDDWQAWKEAEKASPGNQNGYLYVDPRLQEIKKRYAKNLLTHVNPYTGKAYGEEEAIAIYEVFNENGFVYGALSNGFAKWHPFFLKELQDRWNAWLRKKYADDAGLTKAWGALKPGESLQGSTVAPAPVLAQRADYPEARAADFVRFFVELTDAFRQDFRSYCRSLFPAGVGVNGAPFSFDTQYRPSPAWSYGQSLGDVNSFGMYFWNLESTLAKPPAAYLIDSFTVENKPSVLYETNVGRPDPFRAEYPLKLAVLASWQDWDGIFWHYWGPSGKTGPDDLGYLTGIVMPPYANDYWTAVHHELDPVMVSSMIIGGQIFQRGLLPPAVKPDVVEIGGKGLFSYADFQGVDVGRRTFASGSRLRFAPEADSEVTLNGAPLSAPGRIEKAIASGPFVKWDWPNERLIVDSSTVKAYVGKVAGPFRFADGITLDGVSTPWVCFSMLSQDGKPLAGPDPTGHILVGAVSDARNTGFQFNYHVQGGPVDQANAVGDVGHEPIVVTPVGYTLWFPTRVDGVFKSYDFALRESGSQALSSTNQIARSGPTPLVSVLAIDRRGEVAPLPLSEATAIPVQDTDAADVSAPAPETAALSAFPLMPELPWDQGYGAAYRALKGSSYAFTTISGEDTGSQTHKKISLDDLKLPSLWNDAADVDLNFADDKLAGVEVTFGQPPALSTIVDDFTKRLGPPGENKVEAQYGTSRVHWTRPTVPHDVVVTESQGTLKILITP